jgi:hypothetical protein
MIQADEFDAGTRLRHSLGTRSRRTLFTCPDRNGSDLSKRLVGKRFGSPLRSNTAFWRAMILACCGPLYSSIPWWRRGFSVARLGTGGFPQRKRLSPLGAQGRGVGSRRGRVSVRCGERYWAEVFFMDNDDYPCRTARNRLACKRIGFKRGGQVSQSDVSVQAQAGGLPEDHHLSVEVSHRHAVVGFNDHFASNRLFLHLSKRLGDSCRSRVSPEVGRHIGDP